MNDADDRVAIGRIGRPHGIRSRVRVKPFTESFDLFTKGRRVYIQPEEGEADRLEIIEADSHKGLALIRFKGVVNRQQAERLSGAWVLVDRVDLPAADEDEYYWADLIGLEVHLAGGGLLGRVRGLLETGEHDLLVTAREDGSEVMIPFQETFITEVDLAAGRLTVDPPEGLLSL